MHSGHVLEPHRSEFEVLHFYLKNSVNFVKLPNLSGSDSVCNLWNEARSPYVTWQLWRGCKTCNTKVCTWQTIRARFNSVVLTADAVLQENTDSFSSLLWLIPTAHLRYKSVSWPDPWRHILSCPCLCLQLLNSSDNIF